MLVEMESIASDATMDKEKSLEHYGIAFFDSKFIEYVTFARVF